MEVQVHDLGGDGPDLLLAHGTGLHGLVFAPLVRHLTGSFRCWSLAYEAPRITLTSPDTEPREDRRPPGEEEVPRRFQIGRTPTKAEASGKGALHLLHGFHEGQLFREAGLGHFEVPHRARAAYRRAPSAWSWRSFLRWDVPPHRPPRHVGLAPGGAAMIAVFLWPDGLVGI